MATISEITRVADNIRILAAAMVEKAKSGHPGGAMGGADFIAVLYTEFLRYDPDRMDYPFRDRFFLDPGHMSPMLYSVLTLAGNYSVDDLKSLRQWGSVTPGHPEVDVMRGVENTSGPLGQGHAMALGAAIAERFMAARFGEWQAHKTYAYISDGGVEEEVSAGVGRIAGHLGMSNLIMYYDANNVQLSTKVEEVDTENIAMKYEAWGWNVLSIDGHDIDQIRQALVAANDEKERPTLIIGRTVMGKGAVAADGSSFEDKVSTHGQPLSSAGADFAATVRNLGGDPEDPFKIFGESQALFAARREELRAWARSKREEEKAWRDQNKDLARKLDLFLSGEVPALDYKNVEVKANAATRAASATVLSFLAEKVENMIVASADLSNSDKTDGYLKKTKAFTRGDFSGKFLQAGVSEFTMACIMNGMALHGGVIPACGTFFVFSDYMKPVVRLAALMRLHVIYIWTHDSFRVGEDGPTHQPIEHEAQIRLMEHLKNHRGERSMVVLRPADGEETVTAWKLALEEHRPVALILSRQDIKTLPALKQNRREEAAQISKGAYIVADAAKPAVVMLASGSEVATLIEGAELLKGEGIPVRVVSVPSEGLFRDQPKSYQQTVLPQGVVRYGLTSGLPVTLLGLVGENGQIHGLDHFGYSAPYKVLDEKFGFNGQTVCEEVKQLLGKK
ncbi:MAG TPA: transketolase [Candidatus Alistipes avicola]|uniref:transketolase n=1 Tax=Candidatus Alistipes avicola TaxID=2838432 RepID=A0A9D2ICU3_9BACT|nr:transketolase [uncultured Alistipes sp.]HJA97983.1 transketolase [Candidatus Alistipes avicola]